MRTDIGSCLRSAILTPALMVQWEFWTPELNWWPWFVIAVSIRDIMLLEQFQMGMNLNLDKKKNDLPVGSGLGAINNTQEPPPGHHCPSRHEKSPVMAGKRNGIRGEMWSKQEASGSAEQQAASIHCWPLLQTATQPTGSLRGSKLSVIMALQLLVKVKSLQDEGADIKRKLPWLFQGLGIIEGWVWSSFETWFNSSCSSTARNVPIPLWEKVCEGPPRWMSQLASGQEWSWCPRRMRVSACAPTWSPLIKADSERHIPYPRLMRPSLNLLILLS